MPGPERANAPRRGRDGLPTDLPDRYRDARPCDLVSTEPKDNGALPAWPSGPFVDLADAPALAVYLRQVAGLARDAREHREGRGRTRAAVAADAGLDAQTYGDFEAGRTWPTASTLYRIADALGVELRLVVHRDE